MQARSSSMHYKKTPLLACVHECMPEPQALSGSDSALELSDRMPGPQAFIAAGRHADGVRSLLNKANERPLQVLSSFFPMRCHYQAHGQHIPNSSTVYAQHIP
eukprot:1161147-Pelagomonas_calceolata.AAC.3